ncbi:MBL fold metallo-hydrolase [Persicitalea jodogahamensis]|uniref:MBL fold metallo-hydrolase n=1 Tax=Persicitalea jodogahamensis TaxID=402147 RepID=A0A8J3D9L5_9BACT|nr:MBL fold metallo-hydrolase [Persicitalea jodogahamensis]GHB70739.1 MBL fold metallo-hydrolase [Persicitalea jodogahamensis]
MIPAFQKDDTLLADIRATFGEQNGFRLWWLGQSGFLLQWRGRHLLFDPYLSDSLTKKYAETDRPHVRMSERAIDPGRLDFIDIVTSSHNHTDHLDGDTLGPMLSTNPGIRVVVPEANRTFIAGRLGCDVDFPIGMNDTFVKDVDEFRFYGIPAAHNEVERDDLGQCKFMGYVVEFGGYRIYHSGDTLWFKGLDELLMPFAVDVALLPINGNRPERRVAGNLSAEEAAQLGKEIGAGCVIPHHFHLFEFNTEEPELFEKEARRYGTPYRVLRIGEKYSFS